MNARPDFAVSLPEDALVPAPLAREAHARFWLEEARTEADLVLTLPDACVDELDVALARLPTLADDEQPARSLLDDDVRAVLPCTAELAAELRDRLDHGAGAAIVDRFPAERWSDADNRRVAGLFAELVAPLKAQGFDGTTLYDVMDRKVDDVSKVRRSITNLGQAWHTDGPWFASPARYIGLYCVRNAQRGGDSHVTSLLMALDSLDAQARAALERALPWDRQGEHAPGEPRWESHPLVSESEEGIVARFYESYVRRGHELAGEAMDGTVDAALTALAATLHSQPSVRFRMLPGQFQFANNYTVVHARDAFDDADGVGGRRLVRVWSR